jgi:Cys-rich protein (TIGR01571 family)
MLMQVCAEALGASHLRSSPSHQQMRPSGKKQRALEQVVSDDVGDPTLDVPELAVESVNKHPKKSELMERASPARAKSQRATTSKGASISRAKKGTASKEAGTELDETVTEAQDTLASTEVEVTSEETADEAVAEEKTQGDEEAEKTQESEDSQDTEETAETVASHETQEKDDVEEAGTTKDARKDVNQEEDDTSADAETALASDSADEQEAVSETEEAEDVDSSAIIEEKSGRKQRREKDSAAEIETEVEDATQSEKAVKADDSDEAKDQIEAETKATDVATHKDGKSKHTKKTSSDKAGQSHMDNAETPAKHESDESGESKAEEHEDLPKLKAWALVGRLFRRLHASVIAFQGGSPEDVALIAQAPDDDQPSTGQVFSSLLLWSCLACLVAYFYSNRKEKPGSVDAEKQNEGAESFQEWKHGLFSCHEDPEVTLCACCCPSIRWALTISYVPGLLSFWVAFFIYVCVELLGGLTAGTIGWVCLALLCTAYRQELRQKFNMEQQGGMTYITDAMTYLCCTCCAIAQEARHVEDALKSGHPALQESEEKSEAGQ